MSNTIYLLNLNHWQAPEASADANGVDVYFNYPRDLFPPDSSSLDVYPGLTYQLPLGVMMYSTKEAGDLFLLPRSSTSKISVADSETSPLKFRGETIGKEWLTKHLVLSNTIGLIDWNFPNEILARFSIGHSFTKFAIDLHKPYFQLVPRLASTIKVVSSVSEIPEEVVAECRAGVRTGGFGSTK